MNMVFWMPGETKADILLRQFRVSNICFDETKERPYRNVPRMLFHWNGPSFLQYYAIRKKKSINLFYYDVFDSHGIYKYQKLQFVRPGDEYGTMKEHVVTDSYDQNFIRLLFSLGKKVSFFDVDVKKHMNFLYLYDFEHVFLNPFQDCVVLPTGRTRKITHILGNARFARKPKYWDVVGYNKKAFINTFSYLRKRRYMAKCAVRSGELQIPVSTYMHVYYFNYLSLHYILWKKHTTVTTVQEQIAQSELMERFALSKEIQKR